MKIILEVRTIKYAGLIKNDIAAAAGVCVSFFTQGCSFHCKGCHNPETWDFNGGREFTSDTMIELLQALDANGIERSLCVMGGEPLDPHNLELVRTVIKIVKEQYPNRLIFVWTGYTYEELDDIRKNNSDLEYILSNITCLIDGQYKEELRDITLTMRGSTNQRLVYLDEGKPIWQI